MNIRVHAFVEISKGMRKAYTLSLNPAHAGAPGAPST